MHRSICPSGSSADYSAICLFARLVLTAMFERPQQRCLRRKHSGVLAISQGYAGQTDGYTIIHLQLLVVKILLCLCEV